MADTNLGSVYGSIELRNELGRGIRQANQELDKLDRSVQDKLSSIESQFSDIGGIFTTSFTLPISAGFGIAANSAIQFEDKLADVAKTTGLQGQALADFADDIQKYANTTRTSTNDLLSIAEIGGQLGIAEKDLLSFTESLDKFNVALGSDFQGGVEEAAETVGKLTTLFTDTRDLSIGDAINRIGSSINDLGAQGAATSGNIANFSLRLGQLPDTLKPSITDTLALGTVLEEAGINAEIGAGGLSNFFLVAGKELPGFAQQMDMSAEAARELLANSPAEFAEEFASSLNNLSAEELANTLNDLKIGTQESIKVLGALGINQERFNELQQISNRSFEEGTSLIDEYNVKNATTAAQLGKLRNQANRLSTTIGSALLPIINELAEQLAPIIERAVNAIASMNPIIQRIIIAFAGLLAVIGPLFFAFSGIISVVTGFASLFGVVGASIGAVLSPIGLLVVGLTGLVTAIGFLANEIGIFQKLKTALTELASDFQTVFASETIRSKIQGFFDYLNTLVDYFKEFFLPIIEIARNVVDRVANAFSSLGGKIKEKILSPEFSNALNELETSVVNAVKNLLISIEPFLTEIRNNLISAFQGAANSDFVANIKSQIEGIDFSSLASSGLDTIINLINTLGNSVNIIIEKFNQFKATAQEVFDKVYTFFEPLINLTKGFIEQSQGIGEGLNFGGDFQRIFGSLQKLVEQIRPALEKLGKILGIVLVVLSAIVYGLFNAIITALPYVINIFTSLLDIIINFVTLVLALFTGDFQAVAETVRNIFMNVFEIIGSILVGVLSAIGAFVVSVLAFFFNLFDRLTGSVISNGAKDLWNGFLNLMSKLGEIVLAGLNIVYQFFKGLGGGILTAIGNLYNLARDIFADFLRGASNKLEDLRQNVSEKIDGVLNFLKELPNKFKEWGKNIGQAFVDGLMEKINGVKDSIDGALQSASSFIKGESPPKEGPWRNIDDWGFNIGDAWATGISEGMSNIDVPNPTKASSIKADYSNVPKFNKPVTSNNTLSINADIGQYVGTPKEKRKIASELLDALVDLATERGLNLNDLEKLL